MCLCDATPYEPVNYTADEIERLETHHSSSKEQVAHAIELANWWRIRAYVAEDMLRYLNKLNPFWYEKDMKEEIDMHTDRLFKKWQRNERWWEDGPNH